MSESLNTQAFILKKNLLGDDNLSLTLFTQKKGKIYCFIPHGASSKKRLGGNLSIFNELEITLNHLKTILTIKEATIVNDYSLFATNLKSFYSCSYCLEILDLGLPQEVTQTKLYNVFKKYLELLKQNPSDLSLTIRFQNAFLKNMGWEPQLNACQICHKKIDPDRVAYFSIKYGGTTCEHCRKSSLILKPEMKKFIYYPEKNCLLLNDQIDLLYMLNSFIEFFLENKTKSFKLLYDYYKMMN